jgi:hypothetical protein
VNVSRASSDALDALHGLLANAQAEELQRALERARLPRTITEKVDGQDVVKPNPAYAPLDTKLLAVAIKFLKDNGIDAPAASPRFNGIVEELQKLNVDDTFLTN